MLSDWSVECAQDDPVLVVPWSDAASGLHFVDLRENPYDLDHLPEAELHPPLMQALRALNAHRSPVFTAKCDAWPMDPQTDPAELETLLLELDLSSLEHDHGFASYIDLVFRDRPLFVSLASQQQRLTRLARLLEPLDHPHAAVECVLRPALVDSIGPALAGPAEGFAVSLYVKAVGPDPHDAYESWSRALEAVTTAVRSKELTLA